MCGIVAGISNKNVLPVLIEGLGRLEYRGYDSAGIAILNEQTSGKTNLQPIIFRIEVRQHVLTGAPRNTPHR